MARKLSKSDILDPAQEDATRAQLAHLLDPTRCQHFAPGTGVMIAGQSFEILAAAGERRTTLTLRAEDGSERIVNRPGA